MENAIRIDTAWDVLTVVASFGRVTDPGMATVAVFGDDHTYGFSLLVEDQPDVVFEAVELINRVAIPNDGILVVSQRGDEVPLDRPHDEAAWERLVEACRPDGPVALDWFIMGGTIAFSIAEHALEPSGWQRWGVDFDVKTAADTVPPSTYLN